jgi:hypothetical protein
MPRALKAEAPRGSGAQVHSVEVQTELRQDTITPFHTCKLAASTYDEL